LSFNEKLAADWHQKKEKKKRPASLRGYKAKKHAMHFDGENHLDEDQEEPLLNLGVRKTRSQGHFCYDEKTIVATGWSEARPTGWDTSSTGTSALNKKIYRKRSTCTGEKRKA